MTQGGRITVIIEPPRLLPAGALTHEFTSMRKMREYDRFAAALGGHTTAAVTIAEQFLSEAAVDGMILLHTSTSIAETLEQCAPNRRENIARRLILLDAHPVRVQALLEQHQLAGAIDVRRYLRWAAHPEEEYGGGLYGLRQIVAALQATCAAAPDEQSEKYCRIERSKYPDLPSVVAAYLDASELLSRQRERPGACADR